MNSEKLLLEEAIKSIALVLSKEPAIQYPMNLEEDALVFHELEIYPSKYQVY